MARHLDLDLLRTFAAAADLSSMTAAANAQARTQGAISQQVKRLEAALGQTLFERDRRGLRLTHAGERLLPKARALLGLNDEIWSEMTAEAVCGRVRIGVPHDLVGTLIAPILKSFADAYPQVEMSVDCAASPALIASLGRGGTDLVLAEAEVGKASGECLRVERLVWIGARGGKAHRKSPLPVSMVSESCAFRPSVMAALDGEGRAWRTVFESGTIEATTATVAADLAVTAWLAATVPAGLDILGADSGLPELPSFAISLHLPAAGMTAAAREMARHVRTGLMRRPRAA